MGEIEWAMWANEQSIIASLVILIGGVLGVASQFINWQFAAFSIPASLIVLLFEYPRGRRKKGHSVERTYQVHISKLVSLFLPVTSNYYIRFVFQLLLSVPCCFLLPTLLGGTCLILSSLIYLIAAISGESWKPILVHEKAEQPNILAPPTEPPPRAPPAARTIEDEVTVNEFGGVDNTAASFSP